MNLIKTLNVCISFLFIVYLEPVHSVLADDVLEVDDVLVLEAGQHLHLAQRALAVGLKKE